MPFDQKVLDPGFGLELALEGQHAVVAVPVDMQRLLPVLIVEAQQLDELERQSGGMARGRLPLISVDEACRRSG